MGTGEDEGTLSWRNLIEEAARRLGSALGRERSQEARWIVERVSGYSPTELFLAGDELVSERSVAFFDAMVERRCAGEPLQYVLGRWSFRTLELHLTKDVLIPRPETEYVAGFAVDAAAAVARERPPIVVDLGTGSGAIALCIAVEVPTSRVWGTDVSEAALRVARANTVGIGRAATRVTMRLGSWFDALPFDLRGDIDVLVSNPPYVSSGAPLPEVVRDFEPHVALFAEDDGFECVHTILSTAPTWLRPGGTVVIEMGETQTERAVALAETHGFLHISVINDLTGRPRGITAVTTSVTSP